MTDTQFDKLIDWLEIRFSAIDKRFEALHAAMLERFQSVNDRLDALERRVASLAEGQVVLRGNVVGITADLAAVRQDIARLDTRMDHVERGLHEVNMKIAALGDDMRQRFRILTERIAAVE